jgi:hypothetical protein
LSRDAAVEYLLMPKRVKNVEGQLFGLNSQVQDLRNDVSQLIEVLRKVVTSKKNIFVPMKDDHYIS